MKPSPARAASARPREPARIAATRTSARVAPTSLRLRPVPEDTVATDVSGLDGTESPLPVEGGDGPATVAEAGVLMARLATGMVQLPIAVPGAIAGAGHAVLGWAAQAVGVGVELPGRAQGLLDEVARLVVAAGELVGTVEAVVTDARRIVAEVDDVLEETRAIMGSVTGVVTSIKETSVDAAEVSRAAGSTGRGVDELIALYEPLARDAAPLVQRFVDELSSGEVDAAIRLVDQLPALTEAMQSDILPILTTLDRVAPDLRDLLDVAKDVRKAIDGVPGSGFFRRRGEAVDEGRQETKDEEGGRG